MSPKYFVCYIYHVYKKYQVKKITKKQMQKIIRYIPIKFIRNFLTSGFIDFTDINVIKLLAKDIIDDNWMELNYLYCKALVDWDLYIAYVLRGLLFKIFLGIIVILKVLIKYHLKYIIIKHKYYDTCTIVK